MHERKNLLIVIGEWLETQRRQSLQSSTATYHYSWWLPTPGNVIFTLLVIGSLLWAQSVGAVSLAAPIVNSSLTIPYQGRLANASGTPFTGNQNMEFRLYNAPSGGTPLWSELWTGGNSVTVNDGLFSVLLGSLTAGLPAVVQSNGQLWLGITVGTDGEMSPRVQLGSAAYSMHALTVPDGSITKAKLGADVNFTPPDGSVTSVKLKPQNGSICMNSNTDMAMPGNWQGINIPSLNLSFTLDKASKVLVWIDGLAIVNQSEKGEVDVVLTTDDIDQAASFGGFTESWFNVKGQRIIDLGAGSHTIKGVVRAHKAGTVTIHGVGVYRTCINYLVLGVQ